MNNVNFMQIALGSAARGQRGIWTERKNGFRENKISLQVLILVNKRSQMFKMGIKGTTVRHVFSSFCSFW